LDEAQSKRDWRNLRSSTGTAAVKCALAIAALLVLVVAVAGCGASSSGDATSGASGGTLKIGLQKSEEFDPARAVSYGEAVGVMYDLVYAPLIHMTPDGKFEPALATSWHYVEGGQTKPNSVFELTLRKDAKFSDGTPVDAEAVVNWLKYFVKAPGPYNASFGSNAQFIAVNPQTVRVTLAIPNSNLPVLLSDGGSNAGFVVGPKGLEDTKKLKTEPDGAGPYVLDSAKTVSENKYVFENSSSYYARSEVPFDGAEVKVIPEGSSRLQAQQSGQVDVAQGEVATISGAEGGGLTVVAAPAYIAYIALDLRHHPPAPLQDVRVRRAMNLAIDRESVESALYGNAGSPISSFAPTDIDGSKLKALENYWEYDPQLAKEELAAAGYEDGFTLSALSQGVDAGQEGEPMLRAVAKNLEEIGIKLNITAAHNPANYSEEIESTKFPVFELATSFAPTQILYNVYLAPGAPANYIGQYPEIEKLYHEGLNSSDPTGPYTKMWEWFTSQGLTIPLFSIYLPYYVSDNVTGVKMTEARAGVVLPTEWSPK
jgi:peptide/nickel transport system substrate-binding protein